MKKWTHDAVINAPIEHVWPLFDGSLEDMKKVMPGVISIEPVKETDNQIGSVYRQRFKNRKRIQEYDVETIAYENKPTFKKLKVTFSIYNMLDITTLYQLEKIDEHTTKFYYETTNDPLKWHLKILLFFVGNKSVVSFVDRVKQIAEGIND